MFIKGGARRRLFFGNGKCEYEDALPENPRFR
jgi:hypothetical protein